MAENIASRLEDISSFIVVDLITKAKTLEETGKSIINLAVGEPDFATPAPIINAAVDGLRTGHIKYTPSLGGNALRSKIAGWYDIKYGVNIEADRIAVTSGSSAALVLLMGMILSPEDEVLMADPGYPCNRNIVRAMEGRPIAVPVGPDTNYQLTAKMIDKHWGPSTVAAIIASPSNPTGTLMPRKQMEAVYNAVKDRNGHLVVDEIYHGLTFGIKESSILEFANDVFVINSFSKYFCMTGWRLGWIVSPKKYINPIERLAQNLYISSSDIAQQAALAAFDSETIKTAETYRQRFEAQRNYLLPALKKLGFKIPVDPQGAFYVYADSSYFSNNSYELCLDILEKCGVAIAPGADFGDYLANNHVRFSFLKPIEILEEGMKRLKLYFKSF